jgi:hypothetical protein
VLTVTNKRLFISESRGDSNQCTSCRENLINTPHAFRARSTYDPRSYVSHVVHIYQPFTSHQQRWTNALLLRKSAPDSTSQPCWVARGTRLSFSSNTTIEAVRLSQAFVDARLLGLLDSYHQHAVSTFNTCSRGPTYRSLTDTGGGYNLGGVDLPHHTPWSFQPTVLRFSPKSPARSHVNQQPTN